MSRDLDLVGLPLKKLTEEDSSLSSLKNDFIALIRSPEMGGNSLDMIKFPGSMPKTLSRHDFRKLRTTKYWVCEKSDGIRVMMLVIEGRIFMINRKFEFYMLVQDTTKQMKIPLSQDLTKNHHKTLLDGELTYNFRFDKYVYMIFDVIAVNGKCYGHLPLSKRLGTIREQVIVPFRNLYPMETKDDESTKVLPFLLLGKDFLPFDKGQNIFPRIQCYNEDNGNRYIYEHEKRYNDNDGLIFTPEDLPYHFFSDNNVLKWKWPELNTIDFLVKHYVNKSNDNCFTLYMQGSSEPMKYRPVSFSLEDEKRLLTDLEDREEGIIECAYDTKQGRWTYHRLREDKSVANHVKTVVQSMETIAESISKTELIEVFQSNGSSAQRATPNSEFSHHSTQKRKREVTMNGRETENGYLQNHSNKDHHSEYPNGKRVRVEKDSE